MAKPGRPTKYDAKWHPKMAFWLAQAGLTEDQIAKELKIHVDTVLEWKKRHKDFSGALKKGKETPDDEVEAALFRRAKGFKYIEDGKVRTALPEVVACIFWLKNRRPQQWRDKHDVKLSGPVDIRVIYGDSVRADGKAEEAAPEAE